MALGTTEVTVGVVQLARTPRAFLAAGGVVVVELTDPHPLFFPLRLLPRRCWLGLLARLLWLGLPLRGPFARRSVGSSG